MNIGLSDAFETIDKINKIISEYRNKYPVLESKTTDTFKTKRYDPVRMLKAIERIIKNYSKDNADGKLQSIINMLGHISPKHLK